MSYFEDIKVGDAYELGRHTFNAEEIKAFARRFDPQRFHLDEAEAKNSHFGALAASGWHTACVWMRHMVEHYRREGEAARRRGERQGAIGPAPGFKDLKWLKPVYAGDTISFRSEVIETRASASKPKRALLTLRSTATNQHGEPVMTFQSTTFIERRNA